MVNLVLISHSAALATGAAELARAMTQGSPLVIAVAGGTGDPGNPLGTNAELILRAYEKAWSADGVLVLMDMGSALMSAEMAVEFLDAARRSAFRLCAAPLAEGAVAAAVQADLGADLDRVEAEAMGALRGKREQLGQTPEPWPSAAAGGGASAMPAPSAASASSEAEAATAGGLGAPAGSFEPEGAPWLEKTCLLLNRQGLHARPAARLVRAAARFNAEIRVGAEGPAVRLADARSLNAVATLGLAGGSRVLLRARGPEAAQALEVLGALFADAFGERDAAPEASRAQIPRLPSLSKAGEGAAAPIRGVPASAGCASGPAILARREAPRLSGRAAKDPATEWKALQDAIARVRVELEALGRRVAAASNAWESEIMDAQVLFLSDPEQLERAKGRIDSGGLNAEVAWKQSYEESVRAWESLDDPYLRARALDAADAGSRVLGALLGASGGMRIESPGILVVDELAPSDAAGLDPSLVLGLCAERGGPTSHGAILARGLGIPAVLGCGPLLDRIVEGQTLAIDGDSGRLWPWPSTELLENLDRRAREASFERERSRARAQTPARTRDGLRIEIAANAGAPGDVEAAKDNGAEGIGLLRTEFLFMDRSEAPGEEEQAAAYRGVADAMRGLPVIVRTLDAGGDKPLSYLRMEREDNPFLGVRAIRLSLERPEFFKTQLRAILRASVGANLRLMFPMVAELPELLRAKALLAEARAELLGLGVQVAEGLELGVMVEIPAAAELAERLAPEVDFFSVGSNDLTQYCLAAERGNARLAGLQDGLHPAVLRMVARTVAAAKARGAWTGVCGELAGDLEAIPILVGLGVRELSMAARRIPEAKRVVDGLDSALAARWADEALALSSAAEVRALVRSLRLPGA